MKTAIVLSGGGGKGAYQIGFWKAIRQLGIKYDIITGTSIGALNGAFMVQKDYHNAFNLWYTMSYDKILEGTLDSSYYNPKERKDVILKYVKGAAKGGLNVPGLENVINKYLKPDLFYKSDVDYGLVTVKFPSLKPVMLTKNEIPKDKLADYLLATASCFPAFKTKKIDNESYIDGGYYDNMPVDLAVKMGADNIICVDLRAPGIMRKNNYSNIPIKIISSKNGIGNFLVLEKHAARRAMQLGYNDTMKMFDKLDGNYFTFKKDSLKRNFNRKYEKYINILEMYIKKENIKGKYKKLYGFEKETIFNDVLENIMKAFEINDAEIYRASYVNVVIKKILKKEEDMSFSNIKKIIKQEKLSKKLIDKKLIIYIYNELNTKNINSKTIYNLSVLFPDSFLCAIYLKTIIN